MSLVWLRHPRPAVRPGFCYGRLDVGEGQTAAAEIAAALRTTPPASVVIASPAARCRRLSEQVAARDRASLQLDPRLLELDFGRWEGQAWDSIPRAESDPWAEDPWHRAPPGGECFASLHARVAAVLADLPNNTVLVCHAGPIRAGRMILGGETFEAAFARPVPYAEPLELRREEA